MSNKNILNCVFIVLILTNGSLLPQEKLEPSSYHNSKFDAIADSSDNTHYNYNSGFGIQLRGGIKFPESGDYYYGTNFGFSGGITILIPIGKSLDLQPEFNCSNSPNHSTPNNGYRPNGSISTNEIAVMLGIKYFVKDFIIKFIPGLGLVKRSKVKYNSDSKIMLSYNLGIGIYKNISPHLTAGFELKQQWASSLGIGAIRFFPFISSFGITYFLSKN